MTRLRIPVALVVLVLLGGCSPAETPETATTADAELGSLRQRAEQGDAQAQADLRFRYDTGEGVPQDDVEAVRWYRLAADQGHAPAQSNLGVMYDTGRGVPQDDVEAAKWTRLAADQGHADAQSNLGVMYADGQGVPQDDVEAARWTRLAADQGHARAQYNLGVMYSTGRGVPQDDVEAHKWVNLAASRATGDDQKQFAERRDILAKLMPPAQIAEAQKLARERQAAFDTRQE